jgi:hypothetical protein
MVETGEVAQVKITLNGPGSVGMVEINGAQVQCDDYTLEKGEAGQYDTLHILQKCKGVVEGTCRILMDADRCPFGWVPPETLAQAQQNTPKAQTRTALNQVANLRQKLTDLRATLDEKLAKITELQATLDTKNARIVELQADVDAKALEIADLKKQLEEKGTVTSK